MENDTIKFIRRKDYKYIKHLGEGACGKTILLNDDVINQDYVCKKYAPFSNDYQEEFFERFVDEIKLLHLLYHRNIVRIFNYYLYPDIFAGYILMEYIDGTEIDEYLKDNPENLNDIFVQTINGFTHLEENNILHRDIRTRNIMVSSNGVVKIIDFGFGKQIEHTSDFEKSISLNWWCDLPDDFSEKTYDFTTEIYFVGKLFELIINNLNLTSFKYGSILQNMCSKNNFERVPTFKKIINEISSKEFNEFEFTENDLFCYREFSSGLENILSKISDNTKYNTDIDSIIENLDKLYKAVMLEKYIPYCPNLLRCFINSPYYFNKNAQMPVWVLKNFLDLIKSSTKERRSIILNNIYSKLDSIERYSESFSESDIPF